MSSPPATHGSQHSNSAKSSHSSADIFSAATVASTEEQPSSLGSLFRESENQQAIAYVLHSMYSWATDGYNVEQLEFTLSRSQYIALLEILDRDLEWTKLVKRPQLQEHEAKRKENSQRNIVRRALGEYCAEKLARCAAWLDRTHWDYEEPRLSFRIGTEIRNSAVNVIRCFITKRFQGALDLVNADLCIHHGDRILTYESSTNKAEPDLNFWVGQPFNEAPFEDDSMGDVSGDEAHSKDGDCIEISRCLDPAPEYPGLIFEVEYIQRSKGSVRCVILLDATYVPPSHQPTTLQIPDITLNAWRSTSPANLETDPTVEHFIQDKVIWQYRAGPPQSIVKLDGCIELTLGDLADTLSGETTTISIKWKVLHRAFRQAYQKHRKRVAPSKRGTEKVIEAPLQPGHSSVITRLELC
ncbi:hypothetical protein F5Y14DRAFT_449946 [Nemania sp. NC0429]|nr:hypothetical protein F5Y14DRAFT_449946 [Nemania sp. NC0429]